MRFEARPLKEGSHYAKGSRLRMAWWMVMVLATGVLLLVEPQAPFRLALMTVLAWLAFPISFLVAPVSQHLMVTWLDVSSVRMTDLVLVLGFAIFGFWQWFNLMPRLFRRHR